MAGSGVIRRLSVVVSADNRASSELQQVDQDADEVSESLDEADQKAKALRTSFYALTGATTAVVGAMAAMTSLGANIDTTLATVQATSGATAEDMSLITSEIQAIGAEMPVLMTDVAEAFRELSFAGFDAAESVAAVGAVTDLAIAGQLSIAESSRIVTSNLRAFNLEARQAGAVASAMGSTFASSALTIGELGHALEYVAPVASTAGQSILEVSAALGVLADNGVRASRAGTGLQQFFSSITNPTGRAKDAMEQLGLQTEDFLDEEGNFRDMHQMVGILADEMEGLSEAERLQVLIDMFGARGARAIAPLIDNVDELNEKIGQAAAADLKTAIEEFTEMDAGEIESLDEAVMFDLKPNMSQEDVLSEIHALRDELSEEELAAQVQVAFGVDERTAQILASDIAAGHSVDELNESLNNATTEADIAAAQMATVGGQIEYITGSIESMAYTIYTGFRPALKVVFGILIDFLDILTENEWALKAFGAALFLAAGALGAMTLAAGAALVKLSLAGGTLAMLATGLRATATGAFLMGSASKMASGFVWLMTANMASLRAAAAGVIPALRGSAGALTLLRAGLYKAATAVVAFFTALGPVGWLVLLISGAILAYTTNLFGFRDAVNKVLSPVRALAGALRWMGESILWLGEATAWIAKWTGGAILSALVWPFQALASAISSLVGWYGELGALGKLVVGAFFPILPLLWGIGEAFEFVGDVAEAIGDLLGDIPGAVRDAWADLGMGIGDSLRAATPYIRALIDPIVAVIDWFGSLGEKVEYIGDLIHNTFADIEERLASIPGLGMIFDETPERKGEGQSLIPGMGAEEPAPAPDSGGLIQPLVQGVQQDEGMLESAVHGAVEGAASFLPQSDAERGPLSDLTQRGRALIDTLTGGVSQQEGGLASTIGSIAQTMTSALPDSLTVPPQIGGLDPLLGQLPQTLGGGGGGGAGGGGAAISVSVTVNNDFGDASEPQAVAEATGTSVREAADSVIRDLEDAFDMSRNAPTGGAG